ncbi:hypothetical protein ACMD2_12048, partial [Ananas comosus]
LKITYNKLEFDREDQEITELEDLHISICENSTLSSFQVGSTATK